MKKHGRLINTWCLPDRDPRRRGRDAPRRLRSGPGVVASGPVRRRRLDLHP